MIPVEFSKVSTDCSYLRPDIDDRLIEALHIYEVGYDTPTGERMKPIKLNELSRVYSTEIYNQSDSFEQQIHVGVTNDEVSVMAAFSPKIRMADRAGINTIAVHPEYRRQGLAPRMISYLAKLAIRENVQLLRLTAASPKLADYYLSLGFKYDEITAGSYRNKQPKMAIPTDIAISIADRTNRNLNFS